MSSESLQYSHRRISRILWAIDPFEKDLIIDPQTIADLNQWTQSHDILVEPVYVFAPMGGIEVMAKEKIIEQVLGVAKQLDLYRFQNPRC